MIKRELHKLNGKVSFDLCDPKNAAAVLALKFNVTEAMMAYRLGELGLIK